MIKFHEYRLTKNCRPSPESAHMSVNQFYHEVDQWIRNGWNPGEHANLVLAEIGYVRSRRPFYHVYPAVEACLANTKLDFELQQIGHLDEVIAMCFAVGKEPLLSNGKVAAMLVELAHSTENVANGRVNNNPILRLAVDRIRKDGKRCFTTVVYNRTGLISDSTGELGDKTKLVSLAVGVALIAQDPRFAEPILLKRDQGKDLDEVALKRAIERAKRRGRNGVAIGKGLEVSPHMRRPHFAIRWTGKGAAVPKLVPVKGSMVSRDKMFPVPTGHLDK